MHPKLIEDLKNNTSAKIFIHEPLSKHTSLKIGAPADLLVIPREATDLKYILKKAEENKIPMVIMGNGSNLLCPDENFHGIVIKMAGNTDELKIENSAVISSSQILVSELLAKLQEIGLSGLEFIHGVPASLGGAVWMNLGAFGYEIGDFVAEVEVMDFKGNTKILSHAELNFGYRYSSLQATKQILTKVKLKLRPDSKEEIKNRMNTCLKMRIEKSPLHLPSAGSFFKNPPNDYAARLIEAAGCKGMRLGGAQISEKHANFIVNLGGAKAADVIKLMEKVKKMVFDKFKVELTPEIKIFKQIDKN